MKKTVFLLLAALTYYISGMYLSAPLMVLFIAETAIFALMFVLSRYFKRRLVIKLNRQNASVHKSVAFSCGVQAENGGRLPIGRFGARISSHYLQTEATEQKLVIGGIDKRSNGALDFKMTAQYCGLISLSLDKVRVYDYLSLFSAKVKAKDEIKIAVFPVEKVLRIDLGSSVWRDRAYTIAPIMQHLGDDHSEIRQIREHQPTDSSRHIHWNQSARTQQLWIKEYEAEPDLPVDVFLNFCSEQKEDIRQLDAFYEIMSAAVLGLLKTVPTVRLHWHDGEKNCYFCQRVCSLGELHEILLKLYQMQIADAYSPADDYYRDLIAENAGVLQLDLALALYFNEQKVYQFSVEGCVQEITGALLVV